MYGSQETRSKESRKESQKDDTQGRPQGEKGRPQGSPQGKKGWTQGRVVASVRSAWWLFETGEPPRASRDGDELDSI
jgi:hypothetical protein